MSERTGGKEGYLGRRGRAFCLVGSLGPAAESHRSDANPREALSPGMAHALAAAPRRTADPA